MFCCKAILTSLGCLCTDAGAPIKTSRPTCIPLVSAIPYPANCAIVPTLKDSPDRVPQRSFRSATSVEGRGTFYNYQVTTYTVTDYEETAGTTGLDLNLNYYRTYVNSNTNTNKHKFTALCKALCVFKTAATGHSITNNVEIDNRATPTTFAMSEDFKGGAASAAITQSSQVAAQKEFKLACAFSAGDTFTMADTRGMHVGREVLLYDGTNYEVVVIASIIADTSFTVEEARAVVVDLNVTDVFYYGIHNMEIENATGSTFQLSHFMYVPLDVQQSEFYRRATLKTDYETKVIEYIGVSTGDSIDYPRHSDGSFGDSASSSVAVVAKSAASSYDISNFRDIVVSSGTIDIKITSRKNVPKIERGL